MNAMTVWNTPDALLPVWLRRAHVIPPMDTDEDETATSATALQEGPQNGERRVGSESGNGWSLLGMGKDGDELEEAGKVTARRRM